MIVASHVTVHLCLICVIRITYQKSPLAEINSSVFSVINKFHSGTYYLSLGALTEYVTIALTVKILKRRN